MDNMNGAEKLLVSWKGPETGKNYFVGLLEKTSLEYTFRYNQETVEQAEKEGFTPFVGLNDLTKQYKNKKLFSVFARRLPNKNRNVFKMIVREHHLNETDDLDWEYLRITKGQLATDSLSFLEPVMVVNHTMHYQGEIAGWSHTKDNNRAFFNNDCLTLKSDVIDNPKEEKAVEVIDLQNPDTRVGYIAKPYNDLFFHLISKGYKMDATIVSVDEISGRPTIEINTPIELDDMKECGCDYIISYETLYSKE